MLVNCLNISVLFPFVGFYVVHLGIAEDPSTAGYYVGLVSSMYFAGRACSNVVWGILADHYGRKMVLLVSLCSSSLTMFCFGFSTTLLQMCLWRFSAGLLNGINAITKVVVGEVTTSEAHENRGQAWLSGAWGLGLVLGPSLGGYLAEPCAENSELSGLLQPGHVLCAHPYALPGVVGAMLHLLVLPCWCLLPETLEPRRCGRRGGPAACCCGRRRYDSLGEAGQGAAQEAVGDLGSHCATQQEGPVKAAVEKPRGHLLVAGATEESDRIHKAAARRASGPEPQGLAAWWLQGEFLDLTFVQAIGVAAAICYQQLVSLWCILPVARGGPQWSAHTVGESMAIFGGVLLVLQVTAVPCLLSHLGSRRSAKLGCSVCAMVQALVPWVALANASGASAQEGTVDPTPPIMALVIALLGGQQFFFQLLICPLATLIHDSVDASRRARAVGLASAVQSVGQAISPSVGGIVLAATVEHAGASASDPAGSWPGGTHTAFLLTSTLQLLAFLTLLRSGDGTPAAGLGIGDPESQPPGPSKNMAVATCIGAVSDDV